MGFSQLWKEVCRPNRRHIGSGKTYTLAHYIINRVVKYPKALHFVGANTHKQLKNSTLAGVFGVLQDLEIPFSYNQSTGYLEFAGGRVLCQSLENFNTLRGIEIATFICDEARDLRKEAFDMLMGRLRDKRAKTLEGRIVTSPSGYNWIFDYFHPNGEMNSKDFHIINCSSMANKHLPDGYIDSLKTQYDEKFYKQEILGEFVNITQGKVYYAFDRKVNVKTVVPRQAPILVGMDFNVDPLCFVICQILNDTIYVLDEGFLRNSNTFEAAHNLNSRGFSGATVYPDSTGRNRKTSGQSDTNILSNAGFTVQYTYNPLVIDRVNNINRLLAQKKIIIDPRCVKLISDLEKVIWDGPKIDQKTDKLLSHISDSLGYIAWAEMPIRDTSSNARIKFY